MPQIRPNQANRPSLENPSRAGAFAVVGPLFIPGLLFGAFESPGNRKTGEKQVAMIAQKVMDANHPKEQRRGLIALSDT
ncbi:MAG TPA: hypothetical protein VNO50_12120 [Pyrinomonadaceae bacterium]|nr:hypothetical protein [Pyrinomonadaceae bacterium]